MRYCPIHEIVEVIFISGCVEDVYTLSPFLNLKLIKGKLHIGDDKKTLPLKHFPFKSLLQSSRLNAKFKQNLLNIALLFCLQ